MTEYYASRPQFLSILAQSELSDINRLWNDSVDNYSFEFMRKPEQGMVMAVGRIAADGDPFNLGEVSVTRCAIRLDSGETGFSYLQGRDNNKAVVIAVLDALAQKFCHHADNAIDEPYLQLLTGLLQILQQRKQKQAAACSQSSVDFYTMVRGEE